MNETLNAVLLPLTSFESKLLSETLKIEIEKNNGDKKLVKHYKKLNEKLCEEKLRFTQDEIGTMCDLSYEQYNLHLSLHRYNHESLTVKNIWSLYQKVHLLDMNLESLLTEESK